MKGKCKFNIEHPLPPGNEGSGTVIESGSGLLGKSLLGKRVGFTRHPDFNKYGGAYAEYVLMKDWRPLPIPEGVSDIAAALTEPCATSVHATLPRRGAIARQYSPQQWENSYNRV